MIDLTQLLPWPRSVDRFNVITETLMSDASQFIVCGSISTKKLHTKPRDLIHNLHAVSNTFQCHVNDENTCEKVNCISAVGNFFFGNEGNFRFTRQLFECCEHELDCSGYPSHVYSPWQCLGKGTRSISLHRKRTIVLYLSCLLSHL